MGAISGAGTANPLEHLSSPLILCGVYVAQSLVFFVIFYKGRSPFNSRLSDFSSYIDRQISVHWKFKKIDQLIYKNAKEIYFNEKFPIL